MLSFLVSLDELDTAGFLYVGAELLVADGREAELRETDAFLLVVLLVPIPRRTEVVLFRDDTTLLFRPVVVLNEEPSVWALKP